MIGRKSILQLIRVIDDYVLQPRRILQQTFIMPIESIFTKPGRGTIVTGNIEQGVIMANEEVDLVGYKKENKKVVCAEIEMFRTLREKAESGQSVGILLKNVKKNQVSKGQLLCKKNTIYSYKTFRAKLYILSKEEGGRHKPFKEEYKPQFFIRTADITGSFTFDEDLKIVMPGDSVDVTVHLLQLIGLAQGVRFTIREGQLTVGAGMVLDVIE